MRLFFWVTAVITAVTLPVSLGRAMAAPAATGVSDAPVVIPFDFPQHEIVVQVRVNGLGPFAMLLDTGTNPSVIDLAVARRAGLKLDPVGHQGDGGGTGVSVSYPTTLPDVRMGHFRATEVSALAMDLSGLSRRFGRPLQGILGDSLFSGRVVQFDYPHRVARFYSQSLHTGRGGRPSTARYASLRFLHNGGILLRGVRINGTPVRANLDTGSNSAFSLTPEATRRLGLGPAAARAKAKHGAGFNGAFVSRVGVLRSVRVGSISVLSPHATFWLPGTGHDHLPYDVNIGNAFLQNFIVTVDYRANTVTLERP